MLRPIACLTPDNEISSSRVADFLDFSTTKWNKEKLRQHMLPMDVDQILQIPIYS
jgi:hypothetical protein